MKKILPLLVAVCILAACNTNNPEGNVLKEGQWGKLSEAVAYVTFPADAKDSVYVMSISGPDSLKQCALYVVSTYDKVSGIGVMTQCNERGLQIPFTMRNDSLVISGYTMLRQKQCQGAASSVVGTWGLEQTFDFTIKSTKITLNVTAECVIANNQDFRITASAKIPVLKTEAFGVSGKGKVYYSPSCGIGAADAQSIEMTGEEAEDIDDGVYYFTAQTPTAIQFSFGGYNIILAKQD